MIGKYLPDRGDIVWTNFNPSKGSEQKGRRPALVITPQAYNAFGLCYVLPISSSRKGYSIEVYLGEGHQTKGVILTNQMLAMDWKTRAFEYIEKVNHELLDTVDSRLRTILQL